jgi:hypothetical protein
MTLVHLLQNCFQALIVPYYLFIVTHFFISEPVHLEKPMFPSQVPLVAQACRSCESRLFPSRRTLVP